MCKTDPIVVKIAMVKGRLGLRSNATSWTAEIQSHEHEKRRFVDPSFCKAPAVKIDRSTIMNAEREYDPLLQRWRDDEKEAKQLALEERERISHLNRALDVQILREHPYHVTSQESRIEPLENKTQRRPIDMMDPNTFSMPQTCVDYNILSNLPFELHHPGKPEERPRATERDPKVRKKQSAQLRDFNIVSNRYLNDHDEKTNRDAKLNALLATEKYRERNRFDPLAQKFSETDVEERHRCCDDAREVEVRMRAEKCQPKCYRERFSEHYDMITHRADDEGTLQLKVFDMLEKQRKSQYKRRYVDEAARKQADIEFQDADAKQRNERNAHERWEETASRGYDIINNREYGNGPHMQKLHQPYTAPRLTTWEMVEQNRTGETPRGTPQGLDKTIKNPSISTQDVKNQSITTQEVLESARIDRSHNATPRSCGKRTPRMQGTPRVLSEAGSATISSARGRPPVPAMSSGKIVQVCGPPPPPVIPGSSVGSVYSKPT